MMDKKDPKKKRKPINNKQNSDMSDKENINRPGDSTNRSNLNESLFAVNLYPTRKDIDSYSLSQLRNFNNYPSDHNNRKRSMSLLNIDDFMIDITNENFWHNLADNDRNALASALTENRDLHNRITELEDENIRLKALLDEARSLVEVLTELLEEEGDESLDDKSDDSIWDDL